MPQNSYSCFPDHCYGVNDWFGRTNGAFTVTDVVNFNPGDGVVDNELWLLTKNQQCQLSSGGPTSNCDVEAGYVKSNGTSETWFWIDIRPNGGYYHEHDSGPLAGGDYGNVVDLQINPNGYSGQWAVGIQGHSTGMNGTSTNNPIAPDTIQIGQELGGFSGVNAPKATFQDNEYLSSNWNYQFQDGTIDSFGNPNNPPWAGWDKGHDPAHYPYGGVLYTCTLPSSGGNPC